AVDACLVQHRDRLIAGGLGRPGQYGMPRPAGVITLVGMKLRVDDRHPWCSFERPCHSVIARSEATKQSSFYREAGLLQRVTCDAYRSRPSLRCHNQASTLMLAHKAVAATSAIKAECSISA